MADVATLRAFPLLRDAGEATLQELARAARAEALAEGAPLWHAGDPAAALVLVRRGLVQVVRATPSGADVTLGLFGPRESVGLAAVLERGAYPASALAASQTLEALRVPADALHAAMERDAALGRAVTQALLAHTRALRLKIEVLSAGEVPQRLATLFLHLAERFGDEAEDGAVLLPLHLSRGMLARLVGARAETVTRVMSAWEKDGLVATRPDGFTIHTPARLRALAALEG